MSWDGTKCGEIYLDLLGLREPRNEIPNGVVQRSFGLAIGAVEVDHEFFDSLVLVFMCGPVDLVVWCLSM